VRDDCTQVEQFCFWVYTQQNFLTYFKLVHDGMPFWVIKVSWCDAVWCGVV
jgi:hypothetical protein